MNPTMTRAERTACAGPAIALRRLYRPPTHEPAWVQRGVQHRSSANAVQQSIIPDATDSERLGLILLGIGFDTSVA